MLEKVMLIIHLLVGSSLYLVKDKMIESTVPQN